MKRLIAVLAAILAFTVPAQSTTHAQTQRTVFITATISPDPIRNGKLVTLTVRSNEAAECNALVPDPTFPKAAKYVSKNKPAIWEWTANYSARATTGITVSCGSKTDGYGSAALHPKVIDAPGMKQFNDPMFAGPVANWIKAFGRPSEMDNSGAEWQPEKCKSFTLYRLQVLTVNNRVMRIARLWCVTDTTPSTASLLREATGYFPGDTTNKGHATQDGSPVYFYFSPDIAHVFDKDFIQDCAGKDVKPGTFNVGTGETGWTMDLGTCAG